MFLVNINLLSATLLPYTLAGEIARAWIVGYNCYFSPLYESGLIASFYDNFHVFTTKFPKKVQPRLSFKITFCRLIKTSIFDLRIKEIEMHHYLLRIKILNRTLHKDRFSKVECITIGIFWTVIVNFEMVYKIEFTCAVRRHHVYKTTCTPWDDREEALSYNKQFEFSKKDGTLVGHIPIKLSNLVDEFLKDAE